MPRRWAFESRPLRDEPCPFLCAMFLLAVQSLVCRSNHYRWVGRIGNPSYCRFTGNVAGIGSNRGAPRTDWSFSFFEAGAATVFKGSVDARYIHVALPVQRMPLGSVFSPWPKRSKSSCSVFRLMIFTGTPSPGPVDSSTVYPFDKPAMKMLNLL